METFRSGSSIVIRDLEDVRETSPSEYALLKPQDIRREIASPIFYKGSLGGFLGLDNPGIEDTKSLVELLQLVGSHFGSSLENTRMVTALKRSVEDLRREQQLLSVLCEDDTAVYRADLLNDRASVVKMSRNSNIYEIQIRNRGGGPALHGLPAGVLCGLCGAGGSGATPAGAVAGESATDRIDLKQDFYEEISSEQSIHRLTGMAGKASSQMNALCDTFVVPEYHDRVKKFFDLKTLPERMTHEETIAIECPATDGNWHLARFIAKNRDKDGTVTNVLYVTQLISDEKRRE